MVDLDDIEADVIGHQCDAPVSVLVEKSWDEFVGIPVVDDGVKLYMRKDGPLSVGRRAEVDIPLTTKEDDWYKHIEALEEGGGMQNAMVAMRQMDGDGNFSDDSTLLLRGYIGAVGSSGDNIGHLTIFGPYKLFSQIAASVTLKSGNPSVYFDYIQNTFNDAQNIFDDISTDTIPIYENSDVVLNREKEKSFSPNRDTLADIVQWAQTKIRHQLWFEPRWTNNELVSPYYEMEQHSAVDGNVDVIENNAIYEMKPFNTLILKGSARAPLPESPLDGVDVHEITSGINARKRGYAEAVAWYPPLVERAGGPVPVTEPSDENDPQVLEREAERRLKEKLDDTSGGSMTTTLNPNIKPYEFIEARPTCAGIVGEDLPPLNFEVQRVTHIVDPKNAENHVPRTEISASMHADAGKIKSESKMVEMAKAEGTLNEPGKVPDWAPVWDAQ